MGDVTLHAPTPEDVVGLAHVMRLGDVTECRALGLSPYAALRVSWAKSELAYSVRLGGELAGMFGVWPMLPPPTALAGPGYGVWLLTGEPVDRHPKAFVRACKDVLGALLQRYPALHNLVDARYEAALRWVRRLGFEVLPAVGWGPHQLAFHPVRIRRTTWELF